jgi:hypothetical protein
LPGPFFGSFLPARMNIRSDGGKQKRTREKEINLFIKILIKTRIQSGKLKIHQSPSYLERLAPVEGFLPAYCGASCNDVPLGKISEIHMIWNDCRNRIDLS